MSDEILPDPKRPHRYSLMINWSDTNNAFIVCIPELNALTHGETLQEAIEMAKDLIGCYVQDPPLVDSLPEPLQFDDCTNFAPNPFENLPDLTDKLKQHRRWSDEPAGSDACRTAADLEETADERVLA
jgi:predicted RNase H-like HicB family nuclease